MKIVGATGLGGLWALERAWHAAETNLRLVLIVSEISAFIRTNRRTWLDRLGDPSDPSGVGNASFCLLHTFRRIYYTLLLYE